MMIQAIVDGRTIDLDLRTGGQHPVVRLTGADTAVDLVRLTPHSWSLIMNGQSHHLSIRPSRGGFQVLLREQTYQVDLRSEVQQIVSRLGIESQVEESRGEIKAPIPGLIAALPVSTGDEVTKGETVIVIEAMKMENDLIAPFDGTVGKIFVSSGDPVEKSVVLMVIERTP